MNEKKKDRSLILADSEDSRRNIPENRDKLEEMKKKHDKMVEDLNDPEKAEQLIQNQFKIGEVVLQTKEQDVEALIKKAKMNNSNSIKNLRKSNVQNIMAVLDVNYKSQVNVVLEQCETKNKINLRNMTNKQKQKVHENINQTLVNAGAPMLTKAKEIDNIINSYLLEKYGPEL